MERFLVTGALGCVGAWVVRQLVREGVPVVASDIGDDDQRLRLVMSADELASIERAVVDITDLGQVEEALDAFGVTHVVHLAALQVPFCRENPPLGASVNVVGTVNLFEAVKRRGSTVRGMVYASSTAVYGADDSGDEAERTRPDTHYGVFKVANEGTARIYAQDHGVPSVGLRPYTVYGPARDQGVTSAPTQAMLSAVRGEPFHIPWGGVSQYHYVEDVAAAFVAASRADIDGARVFNLPGTRVHMRDVVAAIERAVPEAAGSITFDDLPLPFPAGTSFGAFDAAVTGVPLTPFDEGVERTVAHFRSLDA